MNEKEVKAIKWMKNVRDDAVVTLDHIAKNEPNVSPIFYSGRKEKAEVILNAFEELEQYRSLGTVEELREAMEKWIPVSKQFPKEKQIVFITIKNSKHGNAVRKARYEEGCFWVDKYIAFEDDTVIAWMPLPEPYRKED